jgi:deoxyribodipyrimidine photolyase-related protein
MERMNEAVLIFPHQLFLNHPARSRDRQEILIEDPLFFGDHHYPLKFHIRKLILHRASMERYAQEVCQSQALYIPYKDARDTGALYQRFAASGIRVLHVVDVVDDILKRRITRYARRFDLEVVWYETPMFLTDSSSLAQYAASQNDATRLSQTTFYIWQRKRLGILLEEDNDPVGGRWTYDTLNRKPLSDTIVLTPVAHTPVDRRLADVIQRVEEEFPQARGERVKDWAYPLNHREATRLLDDFISHKLMQFGPYEDALSDRDDTLFHSMLSSSLNIGLLTPSDILSALSSHLNHPTRDMLPSLEGFIRQLIGWREFMRFVYVRHGSTLRNQNVFSHTRRLNEHWYDGTLGIDPADRVINKFSRIAYAHHIERLMVIGNLMCVMEIDPNEVYRWFMEMSIDAYDWVMVPNVYAMSQFAAAEFITTKPYISGSNYLRKMGRYPLAQWCSTWDGLYWRFLKKHRLLLRNNPRMSLVLAQLDKNQEKKQDLIRHADEFLKAYDASFH